MSSNALGPFSLRKTPKPDGMEAVPRYCHLASMSKDSAHHGHVRFGNCSQIHMHNEIWFTHEFVFSSLSVRIFTDH